MMLADMFRHDAGEFGAGKARIDMCIQIVHVRSFHSRAPSFNLSEPSISLFVV